MSTPITLNISAVNDAPVNTVPAAQTTNEDTSKAITGLSISDVDAGSGTMTVTLGVTSGTLTVTGGTATISNSGIGHRHADRHGSSDQRHVGIQRDLRADRQLQRQRHAD